MNYYPLSRSELINRAKVTVQPTTTPISVDDLKAQIRRGDGSYTIDDDLLSLYVGAATEQAQDYMNRKFIDQEITLFLDSLPVDSFNSLSWWSGTRRGSERQFRNNNNDFLEIPWPPTVSITEISTFNDDNDETTYAASNYILDNADDDMFARVIFNLNATFPTNMRNRNAIKIVYRVGYGTDSDDVPADIRAGIAMIGAYLYRNRGDCNECDCVAASGGKSFLDGKSVYSLI